MSDLILKCGVCEASLPEGKRKYCSTACSNRGKRKRSTRPGSKECVRCKCTFKVPRRGRVGDYCSQVCRSASYNAREEVKERSRERHLRSREAKTAEIVEANLSIPDASCAQCGAPTPRGAYGRPKKYCSSTCLSRSEYYRNKDNRGPCSEVDCGRPVQAKGLCGSHYSLKWRRENRDKARAVRQRYRTRKLDAWVEDVDPSKILERDGWACHICGDDIPKDAKYPDRLSPSMDHVVPLARGGLHEMGNVKAAHFICNSIKRDNVDYVHDPLMIES